MLTASGPGRNSVRLKSKAQYRDHVAVFNVKHIPQGCATWPAIWELGDNWPASGEIDILEGVNDNGTNAASLHTSPNCIMPASGRAQTGTTQTTNCDVNVNGNSGCGVAATGTGTYGPSFNKNGGGWLVLERSSSAIKVYFWPRSSSTVPSGVKSGAGSIDTSKWGVPVANFPNTNCDFSTHFGPMNIIINLTLCGDWAGNVFNQDGCPGTCVDYVNANPAAFVNAYFEFASLNIYE
ncbi:glycoside hydrolase family 16 protein [Plicaturopsis crispa FD-325 SS-3]|nr:glycoside hydrolase family 16 protein [Plicaturopsis crispa FD-325 SS-3]